MTGLFEQVLHHLEGNETETQNWQTADGIKTVEFHSFGPDRWIESVHERSRMTGIECLAMILFEIDTSLHNPEPARRIVEAWAVELRKAATTGEIQARNPVTLLALETVPDGLEWLLSMADADKFIAARGMDWRFADVALHLFKECEQSIQNRRFPPWMRTAPAQNTATPAPNETKEQRQDRRLFECEAAGISFKNYKGRLPDGVGKVAELMGISRQALSKDLEEVLERRESAKKEGVRVHRA